ncbi:DEAD/DEAH box helicase [Micrococcales bacterium 31B]|nr:DEAD/DEAH box helicase [Micrococcales bacterium 31B]
MRPTYASLTPQHVEQVAARPVTFHEADLPRDARFIALGESPVVVTLAQMHGVFSLARRRPESASASVIAWARAAQMGLQFVARTAYFETPAPTPAPTPSTDPGGSTPAPAAAPVLRMGPYTAVDVKAIGEVARQVAAAASDLDPLTATGLVMAFLDAMADTTGSANALPRGGEAALATASAARERARHLQRELDTAKQQQLPLDDAPVANAPRPGSPFRRAQRGKIRTDLMRQVEERASGHITLSFRVDLPRLARPDAAADTDRKGWLSGEHVDLAEAMERNLPFTLTAQIHSTARPGEVRDAEVVLLNANHGYGFDAHARVRAELRRAGQRWQPLQLLGSGPTPDSLELRAEELDDLLVSGATRLQSVGFPVHWPKELSRNLATSLTVAARAPGSAKGAVREKDEVKSDSLFAGLGAFELQWRIALGGDPLTPEEMDQLAEAQRPLVRLRNEWVVLDPAVVAKARRRVLRSLQPLEAMESALSGVLAEEGRPQPVEPDQTMLDYMESLQKIGHLDFGAEAEVEPPRGLHGTLREYQLAGLRWLAALTGRGLGAVLADDMGLGKTITVIALHLHRMEQGHATLPHPGARGSDASGARPSRPSLIVCPASLLGTWEHEIRRFAPGLPARRFHGPRRHLDDVEGGGFVLTTYATMQRDADKLAAVPWGLVVADEAQHVKNPHAKVSKALRALGGSARCGRVALTGTPVENNLSELWSLLDWAVPGLLGTLKYFRSVWAGPIERRSPDEDHDAELLLRFKKLIAPFVLRRRKSDPGIAPELPDKVLTDQFVDLTREQVALYEATLREAMARIEEVKGIHRRGLVLKLLTSLKQVCDHPELFTREAGGGSFASRSGKVLLLDELLSAMRAEGQAALLFTQYARMGALLERHLAASGLRTQFLHGSTPVPRREAMVRAFQAGECDVFVLSLKAAGTGLNLTHAEHVIHFDRWWNPAVEDQATDRAYRIGQTRSVQVHRLVCVGTLEERIAAVMAEKAQLADSVLGGGAESLVELSDTDLRALLTYR